MKMVSVIVLTYNHEKYIEKAIQSIFSQKTSFPIEIVIGDDCSSDQTITICERFQAKYPQIITLLTHEKNTGFQQNFIRTYNACRGKYIAICEGDDFWINNKKLQKQVDFLEKNHDFAMCFHRVLNYFEKDKSKSLSNGKQQKITTILDLASSNYITNVSILFRRGLFGELPAWYSEVPTYDYAIHLMNAQFGKIYYFRSVMSVYRIHDKGIWSDSGIEKRQKIALKVRELLMEYFKGNSAVYERLREAWLKIIIVLFQLYQKENRVDDMAELHKKVSLVYPGKEKTLSISEAIKRKSHLAKLLSSIRREISKLIPYPIV